MKLKAVRTKRRKWWRRRAALLMSMMLLSSYIHAADMIEAGGSVVWPDHSRAGEVAAEAEHAVVKMDAGGQEWVKDVRQLRAQYRESEQERAMLARWTIAEPSGYGQEFVMEDGRSVGHGRSSGLDRAGDDLRAGSGKGPGGPALALTERQGSASWSASEQEEIYQRLARGELVNGREDISYRKPEQATVYLTFDDGPSELTPKVLDILAEENVRATFFVLGSLAERYPETVKRIVDEGHAIGNHTYDHDYERLYGDFAVFFRQVTQTDETIRRITGVRTTLFRAPGGTNRNFDPFYSYYMEQAGYVVYDWDVDSGDSRRKGVPAAEIIANVQRAPLKHELIVLLHDGSGHEETVRALPEMIRYYKGLGYQFAALDKAVEPRRFTLGSLKWRRTTSWEEHVQYMELVSDFRSMSEEAIHEAPQGEEHLMLVVNGRRHVLGPEDFYVLNGRYQVKLARLAETLGDGRIRRGACCVSLPYLMHGGRAYERADPRVVPGRFAGDRMQAQLPMMLLAHATVKDGDLYLPLRLTVEMLGGSIPSYDLSRAIKEVQVRI